MTAPRSFREAFTEDPADVKDRARLVAERDSARDWAVALESQLAKIQQVCDGDAQLRRECAASDDCPCAYKDCYEHGKWHDCTCGPLGPIRAALTGGEDDARA